MALETVVITGANRGIGFALARRFAQAGSRVIATCRNPERLELIGVHKEFEILRLDVTDEADVARFAAELSGEVVDILVNNAGVIGGDHQSVQEMDYGAWRDALEVNTLAPFRLTVSLRDNLRRSQRPRVITVSSQMGSFARESAGSYAYRSSKAAANKVMQVLARDLSGDGIVVCPVHPGWVRTDMGGANAEISVEESASGLFDLIESLTIEDSGRFWTWEGKEHPW